MQDQIIRQLEKLLNILKKQPKHHESSLSFSTGNSGNCICRDLNMAHKHSDGHIRKRIKR